MNMWLVLWSNNFTLSLWHTNEHDMAWCFSWEIFLNMELTFYCLWRWRRSGSQAPLSTLLTKPSSRYTVVRMYAGLYWPWWTHNEYALIIWRQPWESVYIAPVETMVKRWRTGVSELEQSLLQKTHHWPKTKWCIFNFYWNEEDTHYCTCFRVPHLLWHSMHAQRIKLHFAALNFTLPI